MGRRAVLLDRDGTLIDDPGYIHEAEKVRLLRGVVEALDRLETAGFLLAIVSNQSGIGRGYYEEKDFRAVNERLAELAGIRFAAIYHCPHVPGEGCACRKPGTDLLDRAAVDLDLDLARCWMVGDRESDVLAGLAAGCRVVMLGDRDAPDEVPRAAGLPEAVEIILGDSP
ncbi:MAG: HAD family hydrolase [Planctomycetota bacterium]